MRQVYLAATGRNHGKTTFALGLLAALIDRGMSTAFTKPVGQRYALVDDTPADEDAILMRDLFGLEDPLEDMSPVHIPRGFTKSFIGPCDDNASILYSLKRGKMELMSSVFPPREIGMTSESAGVVLVRTFANSCGRELVRKCSFF